MFEVLGWIFTAIFILPVAFVLLNCAADWFVKWATGRRG